MNNNLILIPSSRYVTTEMQIDVGKIPPVLIPINGRPLLNLIIDKLKNIPGKNTFFIMVNEGKELIKDFILRERMDELIRIIEVPGGLDLGKTILSALKQIDVRGYDNLIINFGDTLVNNNFSLDKDAVFYKNLNESFRWTIFRSQNGKILKIIDKLKSDYSEINSVIVGVFVIKNLELFLNHLENDEKDPELNSFYSSLFEYLKDLDYELIETEKWHDFGHIDNYYEIKKEFINKRFFNKILIDKKRAILEKRSKNIDSFLNEIRWHLELPSQLKCYVPQIFDYSLNRNNPFLKMEYYGYPLIGDIYLFGNHNIGVWNHILDSIFSVINEMKKYQIKESSEKINETLMKMYCHKTFERLEEIREDPNFVKFFKKGIVINSKEYAPLDYYIEKIKELFNFLIKDKLDFLNIIHGDFCLANLLYDPKNRIIKLVDPRGKFGDFTLYGDFKYELAKLSHSFNGNYESIINDSFYINYDENKIDYKFFLTEKQKTISKMFNKKLGKKYSNHINAIDFIESLLFLSMLPIHKDFKDRQLIMLATGIEKIDKVLENINNRVRGRNIIITMAGEGSRFKKAGFDEPKHMIEVKGKTLFEWAILSLKNFFDEKFIFITRKHHNTTDFIKKKCADLGIKDFAIKELDYLTEGQASTVLKSEELIPDLNEEIIIYNIDTFVEPDQLHPKDIKGDGWVPAFKAEGDRWSFVKFDSDEKVTKVTEKIRISNFGTIGLYYFKSFNLFKKIYEEYNFEEIKEKYIAPIYNKLINKNLKVHTEILDNSSVHVLGTPEDVVEFWPEFEEILKEKRIQNGE